MATIKEQNPPNSRNPGAPVSTTHETNTDAESINAASNRRKEPIRFIAILPHLLRWYVHRSQESSDGCAVTGLLSAHRHQLRSLTALGSNSSLWRSGGLG